MASDSVPRVAAGVVPLDASRYARASAALGRAFFDYELMAYVTPNEARRAPAVALLYDAFLWYSQQWGEVHVAEDGAGAACWLSPAHSCPTFFRQVRAGMLKLPFYFGFSAFATLMKYDVVASAMHHEFAPGPHWYLAALGVEPECQRQGRGGALMRPMLARADAENLPCYLDTHREANVKLYERHGFVVQRKASVRGHSVPVWGMLRPPQTR